MGESQFINGGTVRRGGSDKIGGVASAVNGRGRTGRDENGRGGARHCWDGWAVVWCMEGKKGVCMVDAKGAVDWRSFCEVLESQSEVGMRIVEGFPWSLYTVGRPAVAEFVSIKSASVSGACKSL